MEALTVKEIAEAVGGTILCGSAEESITSVSTNSKKLEPGSLFVPIIGERVDAHDFIGDAFTNGAKACFTSRPFDASDGIYIRVEDTLKALQALGSYYRNKFNIPVIGITGSVGKTTTKEMVAAALGVKYNVLKTEGNMNSQVGLPLMMFKINSSHEIAVIEMGMSEEGEMAKLAAIAKPEAAVMTNIGVSHIAQLKTRENIRKEKLNIINEFKESSVLFFHGNDDLLGELNRTDTNRVDMCSKTREKFLLTEKIAFGTEGSFLYMAENIRTINGETRFILRDKKEPSGDGEEIILKVLGMHNVYNALAALAVAEYYNVPAAFAKKGLYEYMPIAMRGQIKETKGMKIIDDSYNASPDSMRSGILVLKELEGVSRRIAVLADVWELGEVSMKCHYEVGLFIAEQNIDEVVTIGKEAKYIAQAIQDKKAEIRTNSFLTNEEAIQYLKQHIKSGDGILVKGSRGMKTDEIVKAITE